MIILLRQSCKVNEENLKNANLICQIKAKHVEVLSHGVEFLDKNDEHHFIKKVDGGSWLNPFNNVSYEYLYINSEKAK